MLCSKILYSQTKYRKSSVATVGFQSENNFTWRFTNRQHVKRELARARAREAEDALVPSPPSTPDDPIDLRVSVVDNECMLQKTAVP